MPAAAMPSDPSPILREEGPAIELSRRMLELRIVFFGHLLPLQPRPAEAVWSAVGGRWLPRRSGRLALRDKVEGLHGDGAHRDNVPRTARTGCSASRLSAWPSRRSLQAPRP